MWLCYCYVTDTITISGWPGSCWFERTRTGSRPARGVGATGAAEGLSARASARVSPSLLLPWGPGLRLGGWAAGPAALPSVPPASRGKCSSNRADSSPAGGATRRLCFLLGAAFGRTRLLSSRRMRRKREKLGWGRRGLESEFTGKLRAREPWRGLVAAPTRGAAFPFLKNFLEKIKVLYCHSASPIGHCHSWLSHGTL